MITDVGSKSDPRTGHIHWGTSTRRTALGLRKVLAMPGGKERWQGKSKESRREENGEEEEDWEGGGGPVTSLTEILQPSISRWG